MLNVLRVTIRSLADVVRVFDCSGLPDRRALFDNARFLPREACFGGEKTMKTRAFGYFVRIMH